MAGDDLEKLARFHRLRRRVEQRFDVPANRGEWRPQFVRDVGDEVAANVESARRRSVMSCSTSTPPVLPAESTGARARDEHLALIAAERQFDAAGYRRPARVRAAPRYPDAESARHTVARSRSRRDGACGGRRRSRAAPGPACRPRTTSAMPPRIASIRARSRFSSVTRCRSPRIAPSSARR